MTEKQLGMWMLIALALGAGSAVLSYYYGEPADERAEITRRAAFIVPHEKIQVSTTNAALELVPIPEREWGAMHVKYIPGWSKLWTDSWVILPNVVEESTLCPHLLTDFIHANGPLQGRMRWNIRSIDAMLRANRNTTLELNVAVPRFQAAPAALAACPGISYDAVRKHLTFEGRPIAVLVDEQTVKMAAEAPPWSVPRFIY